MKSVVTLYYKSLITKDKNFILDNVIGSSQIETYLYTLQSVVFSNYQYVKQQLSLSIKLNMSQTSLEMTDTKNINYVKIQNYTEGDGGADVLEKAYYYFVVNKTWKARDTIELVLSMDTLNTFTYNSDYKLSEKTLVRRQHKDRFERVIEQNYFLTNLDNISASVDEILSVGKVFYIDTQQSQEPLDEESATLFRTYGGKLKIESIYDDTAEQDVPITKYNKEESQFIINITDSNYIRISGAINCDEDIDSSHTYYVNFELYSERDKIIKKIDLKSEDISAPVYKKSENIIQEQEGEFDNSWILYYKNKDNQDNSPIDCFLTSNLGLKFLTETGDNEITLEDIPNGKTLFVCDLYQGEVSFDVDGETLLIYDVTNTIWFPSYLSYTDYVCLGFENRNNVLVVHRYTFRSGLSYDMIDHREIINPTQIIINTPLDELKVREVDEVLDSYPAISEECPIFPSRYNKILTLQPLITRELAPSSTIDKTLAENVKIINIPYCPTQLKKENDKYLIGGEWTYDTTLKFFKLEDFTAKFENNITSNVDDIINTFEQTISSISRDSLRFLKDSKLYHSDYYRPKFIYDSFTRIFPLEQIDYSYSYLENSSGKLNFTFVMSRNIVSKFLFKFDFVYKNSIEDYPNIVAVARNNEEVLYNSQYLNYVRTGYNYDLKSKERQESTGLAGLGLSVGGLLASIGLSFVPGLQGIGAMGIVGSSFGLAGQFINYAKTTAQNEENIQRKLQEAQRQSVSVLNADDYDLLYSYTQNKAKLCVYEVSEQMKGILDDLFYYCGYTLNEQMIPTTNSRYWFNFVQASLVINENSNLPSDIEDDIKAKFDEGVTFLHYHGEATKKFDFKQELENWEISIFGGNL